MAMRSHYCGLVTEALLGETARLPLGAFLEDIAEPYRGEDLEIAIALKPEIAGATPPQVWRAPELLHGLGNIIENAADFAKSRVRVHARWMVDSGVNFILVDWSNNLWGCAHFSDRGIGARDGDERRGGQGRDRND